MNTAKRYFIAEPKTVKPIARQGIVALPAWIGLLIFVFLTAVSTFPLQAQSTTRNSAQIPVAQSPTVQPSNLKGMTTGKIRKSDQQWRQQLTADEYYVTRQKGTEQAYSGKHWDSSQDGVYTCRCCGQKLFDSKTKFKSGTGWPSYYQPIGPQAVNNVQDLSAGMARTETVCSRCDSHLGHVFKDGPQPTGLRYCMNSVSLDFLPRNKVAAKGAVAIPGANTTTSFGHPSPQKLVEALSIAMAENSREKFIQCQCWERLSEYKKSKMKNAEVQFPKDVTSMSLKPGAPEVSDEPKLSDELEFNIDIVGRIEVRFADSDRDFTLPYGKHNGSFFLATPIKKGSLKLDSVESRAK